MNRAVMNKAGADGNHMNRAWKGKWSNALKCLEMREVFVIY